MDGSVNESVEAGCPVIQFADDDFNKDDFLGQAMLPPLASLMQDVAHVRNEPLVCQLPTGDAPGKEDNDPNTRAAKALADARNPNVKAKNRVTELSTRLRTIPTFPPPRTRRVRRTRSVDPKSQEAASCA